MSEDDHPGFIEIGQLVKPAALPDAEIQTVRLSTPHIELTFPGGLCVKIYA